VSYDRTLALLRYALILLALLWSVLRARGRPGLSLLAGLGFVTLALGFWAMSLGRPYGLFVDAEITRCAGDASVAAAGAPPGQGMLVDEPPRCARWASLARHLPQAWLLMVPRIVPVIALPLLGALVYFLWPRREEAFMASFLWLAFSTGQLETLRGVGFVPGLWAHPGSAVFLCLLVAAVLAVPRLPLRAVHSSTPHPSLAPPVPTLGGGEGWGQRFPAHAATALGASLLSLWLLVPGPGSGPGVMDALLLLSFDQTPWWLLAAWGWRRGTEPSARALILGGALVLVASAFPLGVDPWGAQAFYRLGLLLAAAGPVTMLADRLGATLSRRWARGAPPADLGAAALVLAAAPISFLVWWTPARVDPVMEASGPPVADRLVTAMSWIRENTPPTSVFLASPDYAPSVAVLGGRRVLRAPTLGPAADEIRRERMEDKVLAGRDPARLADLYGLTHVFIAPGDFFAYGIHSPEDLERQGRFRLLYADPEDHRVYEITRAE
jgi:hypothetical protein